MKLNECEYDAAAVVTGAYIRTAPQPFWVEARDKEIIPKSLFLLYYSADYCSIEKSPPYLADEERLLFTYFGIILNALLNSIIESNELYDSICAIDKNLYNPLKKRKGETWDDDAPNKQWRYLKSFILELYSSLDLLAELISLLFPNIVPRNSLGKSMYSNVYAWLKNNRNNLNDTLVNPIMGQAKTLYDALVKEHVENDPEEHWYELLRLFRNKLAHLGSPTLRKLVLHDKDGNFYRFLPKIWPFIWEKDIKLPGESDGSEEKVGLDFFEKIFIHEDILSFCKNSRIKIFDYLELALSILNDSYGILKVMPLNSVALEQLKANTQAYKFCYYKD